MKLFIFLSIEGTKICEKKKCLIQNCNAYIDNLQIITP